MKTYKVNFYYINNGREDSENITVSEDDPRSLEAILSDQWRGLLCESNGLRKVTNIELITDE